MYIRFVVHTLHPSSDELTGIFSAVYALERRGELLAHEQKWFQELESWFGVNLAKPERLAWSSRPNAPERAISWLKSSAKEHVLRLRELAALLRHKDVFVEELRTAKPGYVVYEDQYQVAAIPFRTETFKG
jgi:hypothetical protein